MDETGLCPQCAECDQRAPVPLAAAFFLIDDRRRRSTTRRQSTEAVADKAANASVTSATAEAVADEATDTSFANAEVVATTSGSEAAAGNGSGTGARRAVWTQATEQVT